MGGLQNPIPALGQELPTGFLREIWRDTLGFIGDIARDINEGDVLGALVRFAIIVEALLGLLGLVSLLLVPPAEKGQTLFQIVLVMLVVFCVLLVIITVRPQKDSSLSSGHDLRTQQINPRQIT